MTNQGSARSEVRGAATLLGDYASQSAARVSSAVLSAASVLITTRLLLPRDYAVLAYITVVSALIATSTSYWTNTALLRYGREELERAGHLRSASWSRLIIATPLLGLSVVVVLVLRIAGALPADFRTVYILLALAAGVLAVAVDHVTTLLTVAGRLKLSAAAIVLAQGVAVLGLVLVAIFGPDRPLLLVAAIAALSSAMVVGPLVVMLWRSAFWPPAVSGLEVRRMLRFSLPLIAFAVSQYVIRSVDIIVLRYFGSASRTGTYAVAYQAYSVLQAVAATATVVLTPLFVSLRRAGREDLVRRFLERGVAQLTLLSSVVAGVLMSLIPVMLPILYGSRFSQAADPLVVLCLALVLFAQASAVAPVLVLFERMRPVGVINVCAAAINIGGDILLVGYVHMGLVGPAVATSFALAFISASYLFYAHDSLPGSHVGPQLMMLLPALVGVALSLALPVGAFGALGSALAVVMTGATVFIARRPVDATDLELLTRMDLPAGLRIRLLSAMAWASRRR